jgi:hypothetical protein
MPGTRPRIRPTRKHGKGAAIRTDVPHPYAGMNRIRFGGSPRCPASLDGRNLSLLARPPWERVQHEGARAAMSRIVARIARSRRAARANGAPWRGQAMRHGHSVNAARHPAAGGRPAPDAGYPCTVGLAICAEGAQHMRQETASVRGDAPEFREPRPGCDDCGALALHIPVWSNERTPISCEGCGRTVGTIGQLRELLRAALQPDEDAATRGMTAASRRRGHSRWRAHAHFGLRKPSGTDTRRLPR